MEIVQQFWSGLWEATTVLCLVERTGSTTSTTTAANITRSTVTKINSIANSVICVGIFTFLATVWYLLYRGECDRLRLKWIRHPESVMCSDPLMLCCSVLLVTAVKCLEFCGQVWRWWKATLTLFMLHLATVFLRLLCEGLRYEYCPL